MARRRWRSWPRAWCTASAFHSGARIRLGEIAFALIAAASIAWYLSGRNRCRRSVAPLVFLVLALLAKIGGALGFSGQPILVGSDLGIAFLLAETIVVWAWQFWTLRE